MKLSAVVITKDEEKNIGSCMDNLSFCDERIVVDSGSLDQTTKIAQAHGAKVFINQFTDFASQKNFGIERASGEWVLLIDADERLSNGLVAEIQAELDHPKRDGYFFLRRNQIFGRSMRHGANAHDYQLRLVRRVNARFEGVVHERIADLKSTGSFKNPLWHYSTQNVSHYLKKLNVYTSMESTILIGRSQPFSMPAMKLRPIAVFLYRSFWQLGLLDGIEGFFDAFLSAYYEFVRRAKHWERGGGRAVEKIIKVVDGQGA